MDRHSDQYSREDMEEVGRRLMDALYSNRDALKGWHPGDCPTEIVSDLINARDEACDLERARCANLADAEYGEHVKLATYHKGGGDFEAMDRRNAAAVTATRIAAAIRDPLNR